MASDSISLRVSRHLRQHFGVSLTLHSFRHSVATDIALLDPKHVGITKSVLGHASPLTAKYYNLASGFEAAATYQTVLEGMRFKDRQRDRQKISQNDTGG